MATVSVIASSAKKRNCLTLKKRIEVINYAKKNPGMNIRSLADIFKCAKRHIAKIIKNKDSLLSLYGSNASGSRVHATMTFRSSQFMDVNKALYEWYLLACSKIFFQEAHS